MKKLTFLVVAFIATMFLSLNAQTEPTEAAPAPTVPAANVKSIYSDAYTPAAAFAYGSWGQSTATSTFTIGTDDVLKLSNFNYLGFELNGNTDVDCSGATHLHVDVWTPDATQFQITPIWHILATPGYAENLYTCTPLNQGEWNSYDIPLVSAFTGIDAAKIFQLKVVGEPTSVNTVFLDNIYFYREGTPIVATPAISPAGGYFSAPVTVTIDCSTEDAIIYYTTNGATPTTASTEYNGSFQVAAPATVKAFAVKADMDNSNVATAIYGEATDPLLLDDFEGATSKGWSEVACWADVRANDYPEGLNTSAKSLYVIRATGCENWSGGQLAPAAFNAAFGGSITGYRYLKAKMYRTTNANNPNLKVTDAFGDNGVVLPMTGITIVAGKWQDVVFDLTTTPDASSSYIDSPHVDFLFFMVDRSATLAADIEMFVDDIILSNDPTPRGDNTGLSNVSADNGAVVSTTFFNLLGGEIAAPAQGQVCIKKVIFENGAVEVSKIIEK